MLLSEASGGYKRGFCGLSRKPEVIGGTCLGVFCYVPRDLSNGTWIIAIGHHSRKLGRQLCLFVFLSVCYADFSNFAEGYRPEFSKYQAEILNRQRSRSNLKSCMELGGWEPPKGLFCPLKTSQLTKKVAVNHAKLCETYSPWSNKIFGEKILDQGHPQVELFSC